MPTNSDIEWTGPTWNPIRARNVATGKLGHFCIKASGECKFCYAEGINQVWGTGIPYRAQDLKAGKVELFLDEKVLREPLRWRRLKTPFVFPCSMTDLFGEFVPDVWIDKIFAIMARRPDLTFQVLTKRAARMRAYFDEMKADHQGLNINRLGVAGLAMGITGPAGPYPSCPLPNVWLGVSVGRRRHVDRFDDLLACPAAVHWASLEPLLEDIGDLTPWISRNPRLNWAVIGLESRGGRYPGADLILPILRQLDHWRVPGFVKQLGRGWARIQNRGLKKDDPRRVHPKGGDPAQWRPEFRVREFPETKRAPA